MDFVSTLVESALGALGLDKDAFESLATSSEARVAAYVIAVLAGASLLLGQSVALWLNGTPRRRFAFAMIVSGGVYVISVVFYGISIAIAAALLGEESIVDLGPVVALGQAPLLFAALGLAPYVGPRLISALEIWSLLAISVGVQVAYDVGWGTGLLITIVGFLVAHLLRISVGRPLRGLDTWAVSKAAGLGDDATTTDKAVDWFRTRARKVLDEESRP